MLSAASNSTTEKVHFSIGVRTFLLKCYEVSVLTTTPPTSAQLQLTDVCLMFISRLLKHVSNPLISFFFYNNYFLVVIL